ncbi:Hypothetical predicted protein [Olea europaea subsp. europaea]|uniref:Uncharacterized protein n=1 Tax=Olea europaea subsp. europaea TaxID=158383 RepID=A0A8S0PPT9_OLEEU|nr:Hypothetical predicted protein [Olea europaea subsp. europaea]
MRLIGITNIRAISQQNATIQELLRHMQGQLVNSSQNNEEIVQPKKRGGCGSGRNYAIHQMTREIAVLPNYSRATTLRRSASVFDRFGPTRNRNRRERRAALAQMQAKQD